MRRKQKREDNILCEPQQNRATSSTSSSNEQYNARYRWGPDEEESFYGEQGSMTIVIYSW